MCWQSELESFKDHFKLLHNKGEPKFKTYPTDKSYKSYPDTTHVWVLHKQAGKFTHRCKDDDRVSNISYSHSNTTLPDIGDGTGERLWDFQTGGFMHINGSPAVSDGRCDLILYVSPPHTHIHTHHCSRTEACICSTPPSNQSVRDRLEAHMAYLTMTSCCPLSL